MLSRRILFIMTNTNTLGDTGLKTGAYLSEITHAFNEFYEAGCEMVMASPFGGAIPLDGVKMDDPLNVTWVNDSNFMSMLQNSIPTYHAQSEDYDAVYIPGGHGASFDLPWDRETQRLIREVYENNGVIGAVCHGVAALVNVKLSDGTYLVSGQEVSSFTNDEESTVGMDRVVPFLIESKLVERGAHFKSCPAFTECVARSGRLITGQNPASSLVVADSMLEVMDLVMAGLQYSSHKNRAAWMNRANRFSNKDF